MTPTPTQQSAVTEHGKPRDRRSDDESRGAITARSAGERTGPDEKQQSADRARQELVALAKAIYSGRREIDRVFAFDGFSVSPCWDIMLRLYDGAVSCTSGPAPGTRPGDYCPPTTCMRWMKVLEQMGLVEQVSSSHGADVRFYGLTPDGRKKTESILLGSVLNRRARPGMGVTAVD